MKEGRTVIVLSALVASVLLLVLGLAFLTDPIP